MAVCVCWRVCVVLAFCMMVCAVCVNVLCSVCSCECKVGHVGVCMFKTRSGGSLWQCVYVGGCVC